MTTSSSSIPRAQAVEATLPMLLKQLRLARFRSHWQSLASQAEAQGWSHGQYLYALCEQEAEQRQLTRQHRLLREAHLPWTKALADYDHRQRIEPARWQELEGLARDPDWLQRGENLVQELQKARADYALPAALQRLDRYPLLLIDDVGYVRRDEHESAVLFELICHRYERRSILITSNQPFSAWEEIFPSSSMTVAAVDRLVHHCRIVEITGDSHRRAQAASRSQASNQGVG
jgi:DNA replication protein DnaC